MKTIFSKYKAAILPLLFLLFTWPGALNFVNHFPDEKHYTDAAITMHETGDILTPKLHDGTNRFKKPILTYWAILSSYEVFGISQFSSRFLFWIFGALTVLLTFVMVKSLTQNKEKAWIAGLISLSNPLIILSSFRSIPDILLVLFLTISAWGFLEILKKDNPSKKYFWMAYMGAALAFETKGLPALAFAGASVLFLLFNPWKRKKLKDILEPLSLIFSILVALSWFLIMYIEHGATYLQYFLGDQVGERVTINVFTVFMNFGIALLTLLLFFIPWCFPLFSFARKFKSIFSKQANEEKATTAFIILWIILLILVSGFVFKFYDRYVLPVFPLVSFLIAGLIVDGYKKFAKPAFIVFFTINSIVFLLEVFYFQFFRNNTIVLLGISASLILFIYVLLKKPQARHPIEALSFSILFLFFNFFLVLKPATMPIIGTQVVNTLKEKNLGKNKEIIFYGYLGKASQIRIESKNKLDVRSMNKVYVDPENKANIMVFPEKQKHNFDLEGYTIITGSEQWSNLNLRNPESFLKKYVDKLKEEGEKFLIAY